MPSENEQLSRSWISNASAWTDAVRENRIESRRLATAAAIVEAVLDRRPRRVLDLGCGEGWLSRTIASHGVAVTGIDASEPLIEAARELGGGDFQVLPYDRLIADPGAAGGLFDVIAANFSLFEEDLRPLLIALRAILEPSGALIVQSIHPAFAGAPYVDGWRVETFAAMEGEWREPMPWYFRTLSSWLRAFRDSGHLVEEIREPLHPETQQPLSILFVCRPQCVESGG